MTSFKIPNHPLEMTNSSRTFASVLRELSARFCEATMSMRVLIFTALAAIGAGLPANAAVVFTSTSTVLYPGSGATVASGGPALPVLFPLGAGHLTVLNFQDDAGPTSQGISWQLERTDGNVGPVPVAGDFSVWQMGMGMGINPGPVSVVFDGIKTYTFTILSPVPTYYAPESGPAIYSYLLSARQPNSNEIPVGGNELSIIFNTQQFRLVGVPEPGSVILSGIGVLAVLRRRR